MEGFYGDLERLAPSQHTFSALVIPCSGSSFFFISARASSERSRDAAVHYYRRHLFKLHADKKALCKRVQFWLLCASPFHHHQVKFEVSSLASAENNCPLSSKPPLLQLVSFVKSAANWDSCSP